MTGAPAKPRVGLRSLLPSPVHNALRSLESVCLRVYYRGSTYYCPCCSRHFRRFKDFAPLPSLFDPARYATTRRNTICPACRSLPRHRIVASYFEGRPSELRDKSILIFGISDAESRWLKRMGVSCCTADLREKADYMIDIEHTKMPDASWDMVFCHNVLEHIDDYRAGMNELRRILRPGGALVVSVPMLSVYVDPFEDPAAVDPETRRLAFGQYDHVRIFGTGFEKDLQSAGFSTRILDGDTFDKAIRPVVGPADYDTNHVYICRKT